MPRSTKKSITVPNPVRDGLVGQIDRGILEYPSENAAWIGLARYQLIIGKPHPVTAAIARMHAKDKDVIDDFLFEMSARGLNLKGRLLATLVRQTLDGTDEPTEQELANLLPQGLLAMAKEWRRNAGAVLKRLGA